MAHVVTPFHSQSDPHAERLGQLRGPPEQSAGRLLHRNAECGGRSAGERVASSNPDIFGEPDLPQWGLGHANYSSFVGVLSAAQFSALWAAFGISNVLIADYEDKYCRERGTCTKETGSICTSSC
jgi:hypothetical protein